MRPCLAQHRLLTERLGVRRLALCYGYSMGAMQALHWASLFPAFTQRVLASCGTASCQPYNATFLDSLLAVLATAEDADARLPQGAPATVAALRAFGAVYAGWGLPAEWYRYRRWAAHGYASRADFVARSWQAWPLGAHAEDLRAMLRTWRAANVGGALDAQGELDAAAQAAALARITARVVFMPSHGDRYFPAEEAAEEAAALACASLVPLSQEWGHRAGDPYRPGQEADAALMRSTAAELLAAPPGGG
jgi:homoserine O-acetyltransferase